MHNLGGHFLPGQYKEQTIIGRFAVLGPAYPCLDQNLVNRFGQVSHSTVTLETVQFHGHHDR